MQENLKDILIKGNGRCRKTKITVHYIFFLFCAIRLFGVLSTVWMLCVWYLIYKVSKEEKEKSIKSAVRLLFSCFSASNVKLLACKLHTAHWIHPRFERFKDFLIIEYCIFKWILLSIVHCPVLSINSEEFITVCRHVGLNIDFSDWDDKPTLSIINNVINSFIVHPKTDNHIDGSCSSPNEQQLKNT